MNWIALFLLITLSLASAVEPNETNPRALYRDIYTLITSADQSANAGSIETADSLYKDVVDRLDKFKQQYPDWEPDIINFRLDYSRAQLKLLESQLEVKHKQEAAAASQQAQNQPASGSYSNAGQDLSQYSNNGQNFTLSAKSTDQTPVSPKNTEENTAQMVPKLTDETSVPSTPLPATKPIANSAVPQQAVLPSSSLNTLDEQQTPPSATRAQISELNQLYTELEEKLARLLDENRRLRDALAVAESKGNAAEARMMELDQRTANVEKQILDYQNKMGEAQERASQAELKAGALQAQVTDLQGQLLRSQTDSKTADERVEIAQKKVNDLSSLLVEAQTKNAQLQAKISQSEKMQANAQQGASVAEDRAMQAEKLVTDLQKQLAGAESKERDAEVKAALMEKRAVDAENRAAVSAGYAKVLQRNVDLVKQKMGEELEAGESRTSTLEDEIRMHQQRMEMMSKKIDQALSADQNVANEETVSQAMVVKPAVPVNPASTKRPTPQQERALIDDILSKSPSDRNGQ
jgi:DNA repair exonuclease SbcCD ATPase subunit